MIPNNCLFQVHLIHIKYNLKPLVTQWSATFGFYASKDKNVTTFSGFNVKRVDPHMKGFYVSYILKKPYKKAKVI